MQSLEWVIKLIGMSYKRVLTFGLVSSLMLSHSASANELDRLVSTFFAKNIATSLLMTDDEVVKFGLIDFNPNEYLENDYIDIASEELGSDEENELRSSLKSLSLPYRYEFNSEDANHFWAGIKVAYLEQNQEVNFVEPATAPDDIKEWRTILGVGSGYTYWLNQQWELDAGLYINWLQYHNDVDFNSELSQLQGRILDGLITNVSFDVLIAEPVFSIRYHLDWLPTRLEFFSTTHYLEGSAFNVEKDAHKAKPEAWYSTNGILAKRPFSGELLQGHSIWYRLAQVNTGGDLKDELGTDQYYEAGIAWLVDTPNLFDFLDNVGLGININYGSDLKGGTIILLFNK